MVLGTQREIVVSRSKIFCVWCLGGDCLDVFFVAKNVTEKFIISIISGYVHEV